MAEIERVTREGITPMIIICGRCHTMLELLEFTNTCPGCQQDYNPMGQVLAPRDQWGEETGEGLDEILAIGHHKPKAGELEEELFNHVPDQAIRGIDVIYNILGANVFLSIVTNQFVSQHIMPEYRSLWYHYVHKALDRIDETRIKEEPGD